jgi:plasmid stabilization system protein ParE
MKLQAPKGCGSISYEGRLLIVAADGSLDVDDDTARDLSAHGFTPWPAAAPDAAAASTRGDLIGRVMELTLRSLEASGTEAIRARLQALESGIASAAEEPTRQTPDTSKLHDDVIEGLNRSALFAFLRRKRVRVTLPITNAQLRTVARRALGE